MLDVLHFLDNLPRFWPASSPPLLFLKQIAFDRFFMFTFVTDVLLADNIGSQDLSFILFLYHPLVRKQLSTVEKGLDGREGLAFGISSNMVFASALPKPMLEVFDDVGELRKWFPSVTVVTKVLPFNQIVRLICMNKCLLLRMA